MRKKTKTLIAAADLMAKHFEGLLMNTYEERYTKKGGCTICYQILYDYQNLRDKPHNQEKPCHYQT